MLWGACEISWEWIGLAAAILRTNWNRIVPGWPQASDGGGYGHSSSRSPRRVPFGVMNAYFMYRISSSQTYFSPLRFFFCELLALTRQFRCEDERDKIFGLLGLPTTDPVSSRIAPDYSRTLADIYHRAACAIISSTKSLVLLSHVHHTNIHDAELGFGSEAGTTLPSWIPRWHVVGPQTLTPLDAHPDFAAGLTKPAQVRVADETGDSDRDRLAVRGLVLDHVEYVRARPGTWQWEEYYRGEENLAQVLARHGHTRRSLEKLAMTLTGGKSWYGVAADPAGTLVDFADCLVAGRLWWALEPDAFGSDDIHQGIQVGSEGESENQGMPNGETSLSLASGVVTLQDLKDMSRNGNGHLFFDAATTACAGRRLFTTASKLRGVGPLDTQPEDKMCVIYGTRVPFAIRRCKEKQGYTLVGECYIHEIMRRGALDHGNCEKTWIDLVYISG